MNGWRIFEFPGLNIQPIGQVRLKCLDEVIFNFKPSCRCSFVVVYKLVTLKYWGNLEIFYRTWRSVEMVGNGSSSIIYNVGSMVICTES